jgi:hypothetical protein
LASWPLDDQEPPLLNHLDGPPVQHDLFVDQDQDVASLSWVLREWAYYRGAGWKTPSEAALPNAIAA